MKLNRRIARWFGYDLVRRTRNHADLEAHLFALLTRLDVDLVLDVGANTGQYAGLLRRAGYSGRILSFEPAPGPFGALEAASAADPAWEVAACALGSAPGSATLHVTRGSLLSSLRPPSAEAVGGGSLWEVVETRQVPVRSVDEIYAEIGWKRAFLKMDTQGFDLEVVRGARRALPAIVGLQSELSVLPTYAGMPSYVEALREYRDLGFVVTGLYPVARNKRSLEIVEFDCVMRRAASAGA